MSGLTFLPWVREGLGSGGGTPDPLHGSLPGRATATVRVRVDDRPAIDVPVRLYGPGDVAGLAPSQVVRSEPAPGAVDAEPHLFAAVDLDRPDLPWLFSPAAPDPAGRLRPWLVLVVVDADDARLEPSGGDSLPRLVCDPADLPDLAESWAWAHAQVVTTGDLGDATVDALLSGAPDRALSRLLCPRRLQPQRPYLAAVVPAFEAGRLAGLGRPLDDADRDRLRPAWPPVDGSGEGWALPVYHSWTFRTGRAGDFESLTRRLVPRSLPGTVGARELDIGDAGGGLPHLDPADPHRVVDLEGALRTPGTAPRDWDAGTRQAFEHAYERVLAPRPDRLSPPLHGGVQAGAVSLPGDGGQPSWLRELNVDPRHRAAAGLGAEIVSRHQEDLVAAAWDQAAEVRRVNDALRRGQLARTATDSIYRRRIGATAAPGDGLDDARLLQVTRAAQDDVPTGPGGRTAGTELEGNEEAAAAASPAFRRLTRPTGPLTRRAGGDADAAPRALADLASRELTATPPVTPPAGLLGLEDFSDDEAFARLRGDRLSPRWWEQDPSGPVDQPGVYDPPLTRCGGFTGQRVFATTVDGRVMSRVENDVHVGWIDHGRPPSAGIATAPVGIRDLHCFIGGGDGSLWELGWDGDRWLWRPHGNPGVVLDWGKGLAATAWDYVLGSGGTAHNGTADSVWCTGGNGVLYERAARGDTWVWINRGTPSGAWCGGPVTELAPYRLALTDSQGRLQQLQNSGDGWTWSSYGRPSAAVGIAPGPCVLVSGYPLATGTDGALYLAFKFFGNMIWFKQNTPQAIASVIGRTSDGTILLRGADQTVLRQDANNNWVVEGGWPPVDLSGGLQAVVGGTDVYGVAAGHLLRLHRSGGAAWQDLGRPVFGGRGGPDSAPAAHIRWRQQLGFMSNLVVAHVDNPGGVNPAYVRFGRDLGFDGEVRGGWDLHPALPQRVGDPTQGFAVAVADFDGNGRTDLCEFWIEDLGVGNFGQWTIGKDLDESGQPTGGWTPVRRMPTPMSTWFGSNGALTASYPVEAGTAAAADLDGDGRKELAVVYVTGDPRTRTLFWRIGWGIDPGNGAATGGWSESQEIPWETRGGAGSPAVVGIAAAIADIDGDLTPELVVLLLEQVGATVRASYRIGWRVNARGKVTGGWGPITQVPGDFGGAAAGAGIAVADFSGTQRPDLVVFHIENPATANLAYYRIGWDLSTTGTPTRWGAKVPVDPTGWFGWETQGTSIAVADLEGAVLDRKRTMAANFRAAALGNLTAVQRTLQVAAADDAARLQVGALAGDVRTGLIPERTVTARVDERLAGIDLTAVPADDPLGPLLAPPVFPVPLAELLAEIDHQHLLPGADGVPPDTVTLLQTDPAFVESVLVGANTEMGRELLWREFPTDRRATPFRRFWDGRGAGGSPSDDIPPIAAWDAAAGLGGHVAGAGSGGAVVLLVRGELVRRFPTLGLHARRAVPSADGTGAASPYGPLRLGADRVEPVFAGLLEPDILYAGFPLSVPQARGGAGDVGWFFVFEEQPTAPRFGLDVEPADDRGWGTAPASWRDLSWASVSPDATALGALAYVPVVRPPFGPVSRPLSALPGAASATWGADGAQMAHICLQQPVRVAFHATALLPEVSEGWRVTHVRTHDGADPRRRIREVAGRYADGRWWRRSVEDVVAAIHRRERFYVEEPAGDPVDITLGRTASGRVYLRTRADGDAPNNLLALPRIPEDARV